MDSFTVELQCGTPGDKPETHSYYLAFSSQLVTAWLTWPAGHSTGPGCLARHLFTASWGAEWDFLTGKLNSRWGPKVPWLCVGKAAFFSVGIIIKQFLVINQNLPDLCYSL